MLETLDGFALRRWMRTSWRGLGRERAEIDALNVFPVADSDTGTNLHLTVEAVVADAGSAGASGEPDAAAALRAMARAALGGARGNSGVILAQYLRGMAAGFAAEPAVRGGAALAAALAAGAEQARDAVAAPVAGTVLSVADAAADAARSACVAGVDDLATVAGAAAAAAHAALARTPSQLAVLAAHGVVDAGGRGLVVILDALVATVVDVELPDAPDDIAAEALLEPHTAEVLSPAGHDHSLGFEVMYGLEADDGAAATLKARLAEIGDSVVVSGGDGIWAVHVHLIDAGAAIDLGLAAGQVSSVRVVPLGQAAPTTRSIVVVAPGDGMGALLAGAGATVLRAVAGAPSVAELVAVFRGCGAGDVVVLPSDREAVAAAKSAARTAGSSSRRVRVVPTRAVVQSLAALAVHDPSRDLDEDVVAMTAAAVATRYGALTHAVRAALTTVGRCEPGDVLGLVGEDVVSFGPDLATVADDILARLLAAGGELVTLVSGAGAAPGLVDGVRARLRRTNPGLEVLVYDGGQPDHPLLVGVE